MFSKLQAGFGKGRSCEDNIRRLVLNIIDGFDNESISSCSCVARETPPLYEEPSPNDSLVKVLPKRQKKFA